LVSASHNDAVTLTISDWRRPVLSRSTPCTANFDGTAACAQLPTISNIPITIARMRMVLLTRSVGQ